jgi:hypothetical protein
MPAKSKRVVQIIPIAPRIEQERLLRVVILEWLIREENRVVDATQSAKLRFSSRDTPIDFGQTEHAHF